VFIVLFCAALCKIRYICCLGLLLLIKNFLIDLCPKIKLHSVRKSTETAEYNYWLLLACAKWRQVEIIVNFCSHIFVFLYELVLQQHADAWQHIKQCAVGPCLWSHPWTQHNPTNYSLLCSTSTGVQAEGLFAQCSFLTFGVGRLLHLPSAEAVSVRPNVQPRCNHNVTVIPKSAVKPKNHQPLRTGDV